MMGVRIVSTGVALYAVAVMLVALVPLEPGNPLRDPVTGHLSLTFAIVLFGAVITAYTAAGGLWAVLMTDVLQFVVLQLSVLFVIPLLLLRLRSSVPVALPDGFFFPLTHEYTLWFMAGWVGVHFFLVGAEWAFVQRYLCVPTDADARKSGYLFGALYLVSPAIWLTPPILFRMMQADANPEQAYILASQFVLPVGMLGMMMAAMFSATASAISGQINVFAGALTEQFYRRLIRPQASEAQLVMAGRMFTFALGMALIVFALAVPQIGGAEKIILTLTGLLFTPLMSPIIWGLMSGRVGLSALVATVVVSFLIGALVKYGMAEGAMFGGSEFARWTQANPRMTDILVGVLVPNLILTVAHYFARGEQPAWRRVRERIAAYRPTALSEDDAHDQGPAQIVAVSLGACGVLALVLVAFSVEGRIALAIFGLLAIAIALVAQFFSSPRIKGKDDATA